jgi:hypothetical protein
MILGGVIYPIMFRQLVSSIGFPWAVRSIALLSSELISSLTWY